MDLIIISLKFKLFSPWHSWKFADLALNNNHSLTRSISLVAMTLQCETLDFTFCHDITMWNIRFHFLPWHYNVKHWISLLTSSHEMTCRFLTRLVFYRNLIIFKSCVELRSCRTKDYKIGICCFSTKLAALRRESKDWLARNQDNVSEWDDMSISGFFVSKMIYRLSL